MQLPIDNQVTDEFPDGPTQPLLLLPTLQRNALRKIFERPNFTPEEVARLGYRRLQQAEGLGRKGLENIVAWLGSYGYELTLPVNAAPASDSLSLKPKKLESALRVLRTNGYVVYRR